MAQWVGPDRFGGAGKLQSLISRPYRGAVVDSIGDRRSRKRPAAVMRCTFVCRVCDISPLRSEFRFAFNLFHQLCKISIRLLLFQAGLTRVTDELRDERWLGIHWLDNAYVHPTTQVRTKKALINMSNVIIRCEKCQIN